MLKQISIYIRKCPQINNDMESPKFVQKFLSILRGKNLATIKKSDWKDTSINAFCNIVLLLADAGNVALFCALILL